MNSPSAVDTDRSLADARLVRTKVRLELARFDAAALLGLAAVVFLSGIVYWWSLEVETAFSVEDSLYRTVPLIEFGPIRMTVLTSVWIAGLSIVYTLVGVIDVRRARSVGHRTRMLPFVLTGLAGTAALLIYRIGLEIPGIQDAYPLVWTYNHIQGLPVIVISASVAALALVRRAMPLIVTAGALFGCMVFTWNVYIFGYGFEPEPSWLAFWAFATVAAALAIGAATTLAVESRRSTDA